MVIKLDPNDFRSRRLILEPNDFALRGTEPEPEPTELISESAWNGIMTLPGDVAIRTTSHQGERIELLYDLWSGWIHELPAGSIVAHAMLDSADDFGAALFNLTHGYYKQALFSLRSALEVMTMACSCELSANHNRWKAWLRGAELRFARECDSLQSSVLIQRFDQSVFVDAAGSLYTANDGTGKNAWARNLYRRLSQYAHARDVASNAQFWESNGPIYSADGMRASYHCFLETYALTLLAAKLAFSDLAMPEAANVLFTVDSCDQYLVPPFRSVCLLYKAHLFGT
jgi:hypothetical protein